MLQRARVTAVPAAYFLLAFLGGFLGGCQADDPSPAVAAPVWKEIPVVGFVSFTGCTGSGEARGRVVVRADGAVGALDLSVADCQGDGFRIQSARVALGTECEPTTPNHCRGDLLLDYDMAGQLLQPAVDRRTEAEVLVDPSGAVAYRDAGVVLLVGPQ